MFDSAISGRLPRPFGTLNLSGGPFDLDCLQDTRIPQKASSGKRHIEVNVIANQKGKTIRFVAVRVTIAMTPLSERQ
jgi:hypothetical protein